MRKIQVLWTAFILLISPAIALAKGGGIGSLMQEQYNNGYHDGHVAAFAYCPPEGTLLAIFVGLSAIIAGLTIGYIIGSTKKR